VASDLHSKSTGFESRTENRISWRFLPQSFQGYNLEICHDRAPFLPCFVFRRSLSREQLYWLFPAFTRSLQANAGITTYIGDDRFLPHPAFAVMLPYNLSSWTSVFKRPKNLLTNQSCYACVPALNIVIQTHDGKHISLLFGERQVYLPYTEKYNIYINWNV